MLTVSPESTAGRRAGFRGQPNAFPAATTIVWKFRKFLWQLVRVPGVPESFSSRWYAGRV